MNKDRLGEAALVYGGIKFCQKFIPLDDSFSSEQKEKMLKLLAEQEKIVERILNTTFLDEAQLETISYKIFKMCQKDVYSLM